MRARIVPAAAAMLLAVPALAQTPPAAPPLPPPLRDGEIDARPNDKWDWVHFKNGEWLKGEIKELLDDEIVFESDELGEFTLDLDDIHAIYSGGVTTVMLRDRSLLEGRLRVEDDRVTITPAPGRAPAPTAGGPPAPEPAPGPDAETEAKPAPPEGVTITRGDVRSVIRGRPTELNFWSGRIGAGATVRRGNVDQTDLTATFRLQRRTPLTRFLTTYDGAYSLLEGDRTQNTHKADALFDVYLTERLFLRPAAVNYFRDEFQNIDYRLTPNAGFGYDLVDTKRLDWTVGGGGGWQFERFIEAPPGGERQTDSAAVLAFTTLGWEATGDLDLGLDFGVTVPADDTNAWNARTVLYAEIDLWKDFDLDVRLVWDRSNSPSPGSDGTVPEQDDFRLVVGLSLEF